MKREKITKLVSTAVLMNVNNIDTDQIIPARFLKTTERDSFADNLFRDLRFKEDGTPIESFPLNTMKGKILIGGHNFGCGSSREHAAWALYDYGFRSVVSSSFADIFRNNALNCGLLPVCVSPDYLSALSEAVAADNSLEVCVDLENRTISAEGVGSESFEINPYKRECLMNAFDDIDFLLSKIDDIKQFESRL